MAIKEHTLEDLFVETLRDIYSAEKIILRTLPKMAKAAQSDELRQAFEHHRDQTEAQIERLEQVFALMERPPRARTCEAMQGIVEEAKDVIAEFKGSEALNAGLLASGQTVEHYEISRYGALKSWASQLGMSEAAKLLETTLQEEKQTEQLLTRMAESEMSKRAA